MYTGPKLLDLLASKHQQQNTSGLYKQDTFTLDWRAKVGSFPHPDLETLVSAGEPCGPWKPRDGFAWDKRNVGQNWNSFKELPLYGYVPGSSIRGLVRAWAEKRPDIRSRMHQLLGNQADDKITAGKIEFLDGWPVEASKLTLDIVNPQQGFQVYHQGQSTPVSSYTLGDGKKGIKITVAIRGIPNKTTPEEVEEVWGWVQQALCSYGVGSRTASGYGSLKNKNIPNIESDPHYSNKILEFTLYSQGSAGPSTAEMELRPSHWRGWLRSWLLRFFLGVMTQDNAEKTVSELLGVLEPETQKGLVRLQMNQETIWKAISDNRPYFYLWKGSIKISAPTQILNEIILPVIKFASTLGGVGRGWRRPLHIFTMISGNPASRGTYLKLLHEVPNKDTGNIENKSFTLAMRAEIWQQTYQRWLQAVQQKWPDRISLNANLNLAAEVFSPRTCAVYIVAGPVEDPLDRNGETPSWVSRSVNNVVGTRGDGMSLIYDSKYKNQPNVGGRAGSGSAFCSWASIKRVKFRNAGKDTDFSEIVCIFMGGNNPLRKQFRDDLSNIPNAVRLFGTVTYSSPK